MTNFLSLLDRYHEALLNGALTTIALASIAWVGGLLFGVLLGVWWSEPGTPVRHRGLGAFSMLASSIPIMVYLLWCHYPLQAALGISVNPFITAAVVFTFYNSLIIGNTVRSSVADLPVALSMAATVTGVPRRVYYRYVLIPLALRAALPGYLVSQVGILHVTLFASLISVDELFRVTQRINSIEYNAVGVFSLLALFYFVLSFPLLLAARIANGRLAKLGLDR